MTGSPFFLYSGFNRPQWRHMFHHDKKFGVLPQSALALSNRPSRSTFSGGARIWPLFQWWNPAAGTASGRDGLRHVAAFPNSPSGW